jgi:predicted Zn-ribbon and HTH transcriptional regulator
MILDSSTDPKLKQICQPSRLEITEYDLQGNILNEYDSMSEASKLSGNHIFLISKSCKQKGYYTAGDKVYRYYLI